MAHEELDERLLIAMKVARKHHLSIWDAAFQEHRHHPTFHMHGWPYTLEYGFTCACSGVEREWRIKIAALKTMLPEARESVIRMYRHHQMRGQRVRRRALAKAEDRARALLHRYLTKEQRLELRKTRGFTMRGKDGRTYHVTLGSSTNIFVEHEGAKYALCVIPKEALPTHDVVLAQKVMLETDPEAFLRLARVRNTKTQEYFESGGFLCGDPLPAKEKVQPLHVLELADEVLEDPREWVETRCRD